MFLQYPVRDLQPAAHLASYISSPPGLAVGRFGTDSVFKANIYQGCLTFFIFIFFFIFSSFFFSSWRACYCAAQSIVALCNASRHRTEGGICHQFKQSPLERWPSSPVDRLTLQHPVFFFFFFIIRNVFPLDKL